MAQCYTKAIQLSFALKAKYLANLGTHYAEIAVARIQANQVTDRVLMLDGALACCGALKPFGLNKTS